MLRTALLAAVERGLNPLLALDAVALPRLARLQGKVLAIECPSPALQLYVLPAAEGLTLASHWEAPADCRLIAPASELLRLATSQDKVAVLHGPEVDLQGDATALTELAEILQSLELDWEYQLGRWLGPLGAALIGGRLRSAAGWAGDSLGSLRQDLADYLTEEARTLVGQREAEARFAELDTLKMALDRLEARVERLGRGTRTP
ncbi:MAG TPA: SCP2 sterol-binding domain-containing protein [Pseudomonas sp.]|jgi:ubiquinone biosynthesis protein UbiJ|nr:SCP2 sterol-binding domain-containing protein [Pseudomonas sp.]